LYGGDYVDKARCAVGTWQDEGMVT
jgi:hypothetical protein